MPCSVHHPSLLLLSRLLVCDLFDLCPFSLVLSLPFPDDDLRQTEGFKNVSLGNVLAVAYATQWEKLTFLEEDDKVGPGSSRGRVGPGLTSANPARQMTQCRVRERAQLPASVLALPLLGHVTYDFGACFLTCQKGEAVASSQVVAGMSWAVQSVPSVEPGYPGPLPNMFRDGPLAGEAVWPCGDSGSCESLIALAGPVHPLEGALL